MFSQLGFSIWMILALAMAQDPAPRTLESVNAEYARRLAELERAHLADLVALAESAEPDTANLAYQQAFDLAIARDLYADAEPAALRVLGREDGGSRRLRSMAALISLIAKADRGAFDEAEQAMEAFVRQGPSKSPSRLLDPETALALGEAYLQRLANGGRYDIARRAAGLIAERAVDEGVKQHFANRLSQFELIGQPAPPIQGVDVDGQTISLANLCGQRVLVDFWATWCPPCGPQMQRYAQVLRERRPENFTILGVNLDAMAEGVNARDQAVPVVRDFLLLHNVSWPNLLLPGESPVLAAYRVTEIPATFLIGTDGKIEHVEVSPDRLGTLVAAPAQP